MTTLRGGFDPRQLQTNLRVPAGQRVVLIKTDELSGRSHYLRNFRAATGFFVDAGGHRVIRVVAEADWPTCRETCYPGVAHCPHSQGWPADRLWPDN